MPRFMESFQPQAYALATRSPASKAGKSSQPQSTSS